MHAVSFNQNNFCKLLEPISCQGEFSKYTTLKLEPTNQTQLLLLYCYYTCNMLNMW